MLYGLLVSLFVILCFFLILIILIQQGKGGMGLGALGGGAQMLFGGSGGQDLFQKITWILGSIFIVGSLVLAIMKTHEGKRSRYLGAQRTERVPTSQQQAAPKAPITQPATPAAQPKAAQPKAQ